MPPAADASEVVSLVLGGIVLLSAIILGWRHWREYRNRPHDLAPLDQRHFARQDFRRSLGTIVLLLLGLALVIGGRMSPRVNGQANLKFVQLWSGVAFLMVVLLILAMLDWFSTRLYARRHKHRLIQEGLKIVEAELRIKMAAPRANGTANGAPLPPDRN